ncbi:MAG: Lrp/AsnC family transcriptional regulator [Gammaproteobacteria bacterium]|nr:Lrp/AsnC family transcriptional regulator [Gammaproteobacteria bacterium]
MSLSQLDRNIINRWQGGVPLTARPYAVMAEELGVEEVTLLDRLQYLLDTGALSRFGPLYNIEQLGGSFCLAAMAVPAARFDEVVEQVNAHPEIAHNYQREHELNMWFVIATELPPQIEEVAQQIEQETGLQVYRFPKQQEFFVELKLTV